MPGQLDDIKREAAIANRIVAFLGMATGVTAGTGHVSIRLPWDPNKFVVKGRGYKVDALAKMRPEDMIVCDTEGYLVEGPPGITQCFEVKIHSCLLKSRPEVQSVLHAHPFYATLMSVLQPKLKPMTGAGIQFRHLPVYSHAYIITTEEEGMEMVAQMGGGNAILLQGHGVVTCGRSPQEAVLTMARLEEQAKMNWMAYCAAGPDYPGLPEPLIEEYLKMPKTGSGHLPQLPHFKDVMKGVEPRPAEDAWRYYAEMVSQDLSSREEHQQRLRR